MTKQELKIEPLQSTTKKKIDEKKVQVFNITNHNEIKVGDAGTYYYYDPILLSEPVMYGDSVDEDKHLPKDISDEERRVLIIRKVVSFMKKNLKADFIIVILNSSEGLEQEDQDISTDNDSSFYFTGEEKVRLLRKMLKKVQGVIFLSKGKAGILGSGSTSGSIIYKASSKSGTNTSVLEGLCMKDGKTKFAKRVKFSELNLLVNEIIQNRTKFNIRKTSPFVILKIDYKDESTFIDDIKSSIIKTSENSLLHDMIVPERNLDLCFTGASLLGIINTPINSSMFITSEDLLKYSSSNNMVDIFKSKYLNY